MAKTPEATLTHDELAALDLAIMKAIQDGVDTDAPLGFIYDIIKGIVAGSVGLTLITAVAEEFGRGDKRLRALKNDPKRKEIEDSVAASKSLNLSLAELIEIRRRAAGG